MMEEDRERYQEVRIGMRVVIVEMDLCRTEKEARRRLKSFPMTARKKCCTGSWKLEESR